MRLWELKPTDDSSATPFQARQIYSTQSTIYALHFDAENKWLTYSDVQPGQEGAYLLWLDKLDEKPQRVHNRRGFIQSLGFTAREGALVSVAGGRDKRVEFRNLETQKVIRTIPTVYENEPLTGGVNNFRISPDGSKFAIINGTGRGVNVVDIATGLRLFALPDETGTVWWFTWSPDSTRLVVSRSEGDISIWDLPKAQAVLVEAKLWDIDDAKEGETGSGTGSAGGVQAKSVDSK
jgi:WD40 repeat protein